MLKCATWKYVVSVWDNTKLNRFNWLWYDVTSFDSYTEETSYENSLMVQQTGALALNAVLHVVRSLTPNAQGIFSLLVQQQLDNKDNANYHGENFQKVFTGLVC